MSTQADFYRGRQTGEWVGPAENSFMICMEISGHRTRSVVARLRIKMRFINRKPVNAAAVVPGFTPTRGIG